MCCGAAFVRWRRELTSSPMPSACLRAAPTTVSGSTGPARAHRDRQRAHVVGSQRGVTDGSLHTHLVLHPRFHHKSRRALLPTWHRRPGTGERRLSSARQGADQARGFGPELLQWPHSPLLLWLAGWLQLPCNRPRTTSGTIDALTRHCLRTLTPHSTLEHCP